VQLDVFSGRPNPGWPLTPEESDALLARINRLATEGGGGATMPAVLGYRGFIVSRAETGVPEPWLHVGRGTVRITEKNRVQIYRDTEHIEDWLREQAIGRGFGALIGAPKE
jgi:hypothetical protein